MSDGGPAQLLHHDAADRGRYGAGQMEQRGAYADHGAWKKKEEMISDVGRKCEIRIQKCKIYCL